MKLIVDSKFQLQQTVLIFGTHFQKKYTSGRKCKKMNIAIEFFIFELVEVPIFSLNSQMRFFGPNLTKRIAIFSLNQIKQTPPLIFVYSKKYLYQISPLTKKILNFGTKFVQPSGHETSSGRPMDVYMKSGLDIDVHWTSKGRLIPNGKKDNYIQKQKK